MEKKIHQGHNIGRFRKMLAIKQDALTVSMGPEWTQKKISLFEDKKEIDDSILYGIAKARNLPVEVIKNFDEMPPFPLKII